MAYSEEYVAQIIAEIQRLQEVNKTLKQTNEEFSEEIGTLKQRETLLLNKIKTLSERESDLACEVEHLEREKEDFYNVEDLEELASENENLKKQIENLEVELSFRKANARGFVEKFFVNEIKAVMNELHTTCTGGVRKRTGGVRNRTGGVRKRTPPI